MTLPRSASWMKVKRLLPGVSAPLFHATTGPRAANIALRGQGLKVDSGFSNYGGQSGISMSRDLGLLLRGGFGNVIFVFDGRELGQKFGMAPVQHPAVGDEFEERIDTTKIPASFIRGVIFAGKAPPAFVLREWDEKVSYPVLHLSKEEGWKVAEPPSPSRLASRFATARVGRASPRIREAIEESMLNLPDRVRWDIDNFAAGVIVGKAPSLEKHTSTLYKAFAPLRKALGGTTTMYRGQPIDPPKIDRKWLSWTTEPRMAALFTDDSGYQIIEAKVKSSDVVAGIVSPHNPNYIEFLVKNRPEYQTRSQKQVPIYYPLYMPMNSRYWKDLPENFSDLSEREQLEFSYPDWKRWLKDNERAVERAGGLVMHSDPPKMNPEERDPFLGVLMPADVELPPALAALDDAKYGRPEPRYMGKVASSVQVAGRFASARTAAPFVDEGMVGEDWGSSASGLLVTDGDRVLLLKRSPYVQDPGLWGIPGGAIPVDYGTGKGKDPKRSALDEAREEMGGMPSGSVASKHVFRKPSGFTFTTFVWETDRDSLSKFRPRLNWEHTDWGLFDLNDMKPTGIHPGVLWVLKRMGR